MFAKFWNVFKEKIHYNGLQLIEVDEFINMLFVEVLVV